MNDKEIIELRDKILKGIALGINGACPPLIHAIKNNRNPLHITRLIAQCNVATE